MKYAFIIAMRGLPEFVLLSSFPHDERYKMQQIVLFL